jgi:hypothetical protein
LTPKQGLDLIPKPNPNGPLGPDSNTDHIKICFKKTALLLG